MTAVVVLPTTAGGQQGPVAALVSTAGWAAAMERRLGEVWIVTPTGTIDDAATARRLASSSSLTSRGVARWRRRVPALVATGIKDVRQARRARRFRVDPEGPWRHTAVDLVWQRHELFHAAGLDLAAALGVPSILFVPATAIWEAERWGVRRPGWSRLLENVGEARILRRADLVACGTPEVADQVRRLGVADHKIVITPTGVDVDLFATDPTGPDRRLELGLDGRKVVGWVGSFRPFHCLPDLVEAVAGLQNTSLLLVGDGPERSAIEHLAHSLGVEAIFTGTVNHHQLPGYLAAMDVAAVVAGSADDFHYSPLKLGEYLAAGLPVVAPDLPPIRVRGDDGLVLVTPGDRQELTDALGALLGDDDRRARLGREGREAARREWSWDHQVDTVLASLAHSR